MSSTRPESEGGGDVSITRLADAIRADPPTESRSCPHDTCEGSLSVDDDDTIFCTSCRTTPEGVFYPSDSYPSDGPNGVVESWSHDEYNNSNAVRLSGGYEPVYDEDEDRRPDGVGEEYTFDLTTL